MPRKADIRSLYYITHVENLPSILQHGILSHGQIESRGITFTPIYDADIVSKRKDKTTPDRKSLWEYAFPVIKPREDNIGNSLSPRKALKAMTASGPQSTKPRVSKEQRMRSRSKRRGQIRKRLL